MKYNKENKNHLLIQPIFWKAIVDLEKEYEFRKLSKGLTTGTYYFFSTETQEYLGNAYLMPVGINEEGYKKTEHKPTIKWVYENYIWKCIDYICYEINDILEEGKNE